MLINNEFELRKKRGFNKNNFKLVLVFIVMILYRFIYIMKTNFYKEKYNFEERRKFS